MQLLVWTENYWIGGCDRFLADLIAGLDGFQVQISLAGNEHPEFDAWLATRIPQVLPRETLPIANLVRSPLHDLEQKLLGPRENRGIPAVGEAPAHGPVARDAAVAAVRYIQATINFQRIRRLMARRQPDVVLINNGGYPGAESCRIAALAAHAAGVSRILHFVHNMANPPVRPVRAELMLDRRIDAATFAWITAANRASNELAAQRDIPRAHVHTVHYGLPSVDPTTAAGRTALRAELGFVDGALALAVVAKLEPRKGLGVLVRALAQLRANGVEIRTALVGDGPMEAELRRHVAALGLEDQVRLLGWREDVPRVMAASDALALPSLSHECLPYVILEAMQSSLPVVSTDVAGIPEMVLDGETGYVAAPGDAEQLAQALAALATEPERRRAMGAAGRRHLDQSFTLARMTEKMTRLIGLDTDQRRTRKKTA